MIFRIGDTDFKLNFGVRFAAELDESEKYRTEGIEFGMGLLLSEEKLGMGSPNALATIIHCALHRESVSLDEVFDALDAYADIDELDGIFDKVEDALKNSNAVRSAKARMEKTQKTANRKKGVLAVKPTTK